MQGAVRICFETPEDGPERGGHRALESTYIALQHERDMVRLGHKSRHSRKQPAFTESFVRTNRTRVKASRSVQHRQSGGVARGDEQDRN
jgi:hypothetical protein